MKTVVIVTSDRQLNILYGHTKSGKCFLRPGDATVRLSGDVEKDSLRLQQATNYECGAKLVDFSIYMQREAVEYYGKFHLEDYKDDIKKFE